MDKPYFSGNQLSLSSSVKIFSDLKKLLNNEVLNEDCY